MGINWTLVIIVLGVVYVFRRQIASLFPRMRSLAWGRFRLDVGQGTGVVERDPRAEAEALMSQPESQLQREHEEQIATWLQGRGLTGVEVVPLLTRYVAVLGIAYAFERIYRLIFGSQLRLLQYLNTQPDGGQLVAAVQPFYVVAAAQNQQFYSTYSFDAWLGFLINSVLVRRVNGSVFITVRGREFLTQLTREGLTLDKPG